MPTSSTMCPKCMYMCLQMHARGSTCQGTACFLVLMLQYCVNLMLCIKVTWLCTIAPALHALPLNMPEKGVLFKWAGTAKHETR